MKVLLGGAEYKIVFGYLEGSEDYAGNHRRVTCQLVEQPDGKVIMHGKAECHPKDNFCKETGRKLALARAIAGFNKAERTAVWAVYRGRFANKVSPAGAGIPTERRLGEGNV